MEQWFLMEEIVVSVGRKPQLRKEGEGRPLIGGLLSEPDRPLQIVDRICHSQKRGTDCDPHESVRIDRFE